MDALLSFRPTHTSVVDGMREAIHVLALLPPDQKKRFMRLFQQHCETKGKPSVSLNDVSAPRSLRFEGESLAEVCRLSISTVLLNLFVFPRTHSKITVFPLR